MKYNFDEFIERRGTYSSKWDARDLLIKTGSAAQYNDDTIPLFVADMDFQSPQPILDALHRVIDRNRMFGYSTQVCVPEYYEAIINWFERRNNWEISADEILYVNGTVEAVKLSILAYSEEGDGVIVQPPVYYPFAKKIIETKRKVVNNNLINCDGYYTMDFDDLEEKTKDPNNKILILCSPHNPVGRVWTREELEKVSDICQRNDVIVVTDEIHGDIVRKGVEFIPLAMAGSNENLVTLTAINKTFNLAGLQCTNAVIKNPELRKKFQKVLGHLSPTPFAIAALIAAYNEGEDWLTQVNDYIDGNIDWVLEFLKKEMPKVKCFRPEGTYILWLDFRDYGLSQADLRQRIYINANVILKSGSVFGEETGFGFERVCVPTRRALIKEALMRISHEFKD